MVRNIVVLGGSSHPDLTEGICNHLGIPATKIFLGKFAVGETRVEIQESVRAKDVYIIQSGGGSVNDHLMELLITISACKTASANRVTAVLPLFPYSKQSDVPYNKAGAPLTKHSSSSFAAKSGDYGSESRPQTPGSGQAGNGKPSANGIGAVNKKLGELKVNGNGNGPKTAHFADSEANGSANSGHAQTNATSLVKSKSTNLKPVEDGSKPASFQPLQGYRQWVAQAGTLVADLLTCAGADHVITMDLHDPQYQGFFDIPVDNLYGRHLLKKYVQYQIPNYQQAVIVSPDAGGAKRATAIADALGMPFALIHKERRPTQISDRQNASMMLVGDVADRTVILIDDLADTCSTITRAAKLLKREGATKVYALITHGILSGDAIERIQASYLDKIVVTNSIDQSEHKEKLGDKLDVLDVGFVFAEAIRRVHYGESISVLFHYD